MKSQSIGRKAFLVFDHIFLAALGVLCLLPFVNLLAISFSSSYAVSANLVAFWPVGFNTKNYELMMKSGQFLTAFGVSAVRVILGVGLNMIMIVLCAYPLSREKSQFPSGRYYAWFFVLPMLFNVPLIPWYLVIKSTGLIDTMGALVIPGAVQVFSIIVLLNFFRALPKELEEAAYIDGAGHLATLLRIYVPLSAPSLATLTLFSLVYHWNSWFDGLILMNRPEHYPLQSYLQTILITPETLLHNLANTGDLSRILNFVSARSSRASQIFIAALPILLVYPFLQKYFTKGLVLGSVKG
jgi:putative aldouronate transport system permease protein